MKHITESDGVHILAGGVNVIDGAETADDLVDTAGNDSIDGLGGDDTLDSSLGGSDTLAGGDGDDIITVERTEDHGKDAISVDGGLGDDTITYTGNAANKVSVNIMGGLGADLISVSDALSAIISGGAGDDHITATDLTNAHIEGNGGSNLFDVTGLIGHDNFVFGGQDVDTVNVDTADHVIVHTAAGDDVVNASATSVDARVGINTGAGADVVNLTSDNDGHYRLKLGEGQDTVNSGACSDASDIKLVFWDFQAGDGGDELNMDDYLKSVLNHGMKGDLFADHHLRLTDGTIPDGRHAAILEMDVDGDKNGENWVKIAVFVGVDAADITADNLGGIDPTVTPSEGLVI